jgi:hypothetical protein
LEVKEEIREGMYFWGILAYGLPAKVLERYVNGTEHCYTLQVSIISQQAKLDRESRDREANATWVHRENVPRSAVAFFDKPGWTDIHLPNAFRHVIGIPDDTFPDQWEECRTVGAAASKARKRNADSSVNKMGTAVADGVSTTCQLSLALLLSMIAPPSDDNTKIMQSHLNPTKETEGEDFAADSERFGEEVSTEDRSEEDVADFKRMREEMKVLMELFNQVTTKSPLCETEKSSEGMCYFRLYQYFVESLEYLKSRDKQ